ncbi:MAG TPA: GyrI-like domain-containing protein [Clostridium sp.]|uniref:GyrI-like domain-containing protein n=1 Tax=Clostridium sp. TaxID=1506 RepID=UPI002F95B6B1
MAKLEYRKEYKDLYVPKKSPVIVTVPSINFITIDGYGDPNEEQFALATAALYSFSYAVKMSYKSNNVPTGYYDYTVFPLEGVWDLMDKTLLPTNKSNFKYKIMIRQPDFLTTDLFNRFISETKNKKPNIYLDKIEYLTISEGLCCQILHLGSYDTEPKDFEMMLQFCKDNGYTRISLKHREIYLSDPRKTEPEKLKTVLRFKVQIESTII